ncbi:MAG: ORC1-type DNA replication protein [Chloroflexi bacterium]|nr:ORC1-type DNA replication protein [Chloroflexota bacterium]
MDFLEEEFNKPSVFADESKLSSEYVPDNLLFREEQLRMVVRHFRGLFSNTQSTRKLVITGSVGTGKTSIAKKFGYWAENKSIEEKVGLNYVHVNCRRNRTPFMILLAITRELNSHIPTRGYSADELMEMVVELLEAKKTTMLLTLDEIDYTMDRGGADLIYALTRTADDRQDPNHRIALILISRNASFLSELDASTRSSLSPAMMKLEPYSKSQLVKILDDRIKQSFLPGSVSNDAIVLAGEISSIKGDARQALELMWYAGKLADKEGNSRVYPEHVRLAKSSVDPSLLRGVIADMSNHKLSLLLGIAKQLRLTQAAHITTGSAIESYKIICESQKLQPRKHTQIWEYLKEFEKFGVLVTQKSGLGQRGNTLYISIQDVSAAELEMEVEKQLLLIEKQSIVH